MNTVAFSLVVFWNSLVNILESDFESEKKWKRMREMESKEEKKERDNRDSKFKIG